MDLTAPKNPNRVRAGSANRRQWRGLTPAGREKLRQTAKANQPWRFSTGPRTPQGKARAALNGRVRQKGPQSVRALRGQVSDIGGLIGAMKDLRGGLQ